MRFVPEFEVGEKVTMKGPKQLEYAVLIFKEKFKQLVGKDLELNIVEKQDNKQDKAEAEQQSL